MDGDIMIQKKFNPESRRFEDMKAPLEMVFKLPEKLLEALFNR
jgi:hypothetical protein